MGKCKRKKKEDRQNSHTKSIEFTKRGGVAGNVERIYLDWCVQRVVGEVETRGSGSGGTSERETLFVVWYVCLIGHRVSPRNLITPLSRVSVSCPVPGQTNSISVPRSEIDNVVK